MSAEDQKIPLPQDAAARLRVENNKLIRALEDERRNSHVDRRRKQQRIEHLEQEVHALMRSRCRRLAAGIRMLDPRRLWSKPDDGQPCDHRVEQYRVFLENHAMDELQKETLLSRIDAFRLRPVVSICLPVHDIDPDVLQETLESVLNQIYPHWELCIVDDASRLAEIPKILENINDDRVRKIRNDENAGIAAATNQAISMACGQYVAFLDHDDLLAPNALLEVVTAINENGAEFFYSDEDYLDETGHRVNPHFKPDYSPELLLSHNYITHLVVVSRALLERIGGIRSEFDGAQDYDFVLRAVEQAKGIHHIPEVLYHWRTGRSSTAANAQSKPEAVARGRLAVLEAVERRGLKARDVNSGPGPNFYRVNYEISDRPLVSIVIPFRDEPEFLHCVVGDILEYTTYTNYEVIGINNRSTDPRTFEVMTDLAAMDQRVTFVDYDEEFNFSAIANCGVGLANGRHIVLLNNDIRIISPGWIEEMLAYSQRSDIGAVGGKLYYPDERVQHAGIILGIGGYAGHAHKGFPRQHQGYFNRLQVVQNVSAVTGAFMMVKKALYEQAGGFDESNFSIACNDVDFCLRLRERGCWNVFTPHAEAYHLESASRGYEDTPEKKKRYAKERERFMDRHREVLERGDPFYNPNLSLRSEDFSLNIG